MQRKCLEGSKEGGEMVSAFVSKIMSEEHFR